jgi:hypothetical protein
MRESNRCLHTRVAMRRLSQTVKQMGRIKPKTVSDLMDIANRFADGEDAYNNKRT